MLHFFATPVWLVCEHIFSLYTYDGRFIKLAHFIFISTVLYQANSGVFSFFLCGKAVQCRFRWWCVRWTVLPV